MFSKKNTMIIYLTKTYLEFFGEDYRKLVLNFDKKTIDDKKIDKLEDFKELISKFCSENAIKKQTAAIILGPNLYLEKDFKLEDEEELNKQSLGSREVDPKKIEAYYKSLELDPATLLEKRLTDEEKIFLISIKEDLVNNLKETFAALGWDVISIAPASIFKLELADGKITSSEAEKISSSKEALVSANFLSPSTVPLSEVLPEYEENKKGSGSRFPLFLSILALTIILETAFLVIVKPTGLAMSLKFPDFSPSPTPTPEPTSTPSPTPTVSQVKKADLKVQVLNGTGVAGQAKQVKDVLSTAGFTNVETGNGDNKDGSTTITVYTNIPSDMRQEIQKELSGIFDNVVIQEDIKTNDFDVVILTGK